MPRHTLATHCSSAQLFAHLPLPTLVPIVGHCLAFPFLALHLFTPGACVQVPLLLAACTTTRLAPTAPPQRPHSHHCWRPALYVALLPRCQLVGFASHPGLPTTHTQCRTGGWTGFCSPERYLPHLFCCRSRIMHCWNSTTALLGLTRPERAHTATSQLDTPDPNRRVTYLTSGRPSSSL